MALDGSTSGVGRRDVNSTHQHADVHGQVDFPSAAVVRSRSQTRHDSLSFADVTRCVVGMHVFHTWKKQYRHAVYASLSEV